MDPRLMTTFGLAKPRTTHRRKASCAEVNCKNYLNGFQVHIRSGAAETPGFENFIKTSGRRYKASPEPGGTLYAFEPGQQCFGEHSVPIDRPALYLVREGANAPKQHTRPELWVEEFESHLDKIREQ